MIVIDYCEIIKMESLKVLMTIVVTSTWGLHLSYDDALLVEEISRQVNQYLGPGHDIERIMRGHLSAIGLLDDSGQWMHPKLAAIGHEILPANVTSNDMKLFVKEMVRNLVANQYLANSIRILKEGDYPKLKYKISSEGPTGAGTNTCISFIVCHQV